MIEDAHVLKLGRVQACEQGVLFGEAGGRVRARQRHLFTGASELRRQISVTSRGWGAARGVYSGRGWFERDRKRADLAAATGSTGGLPLILLSGGFLSGELLSTWTEKSPDRCRKPTTC